MKAIVVGMAVQEMGTMIKSLKKLQMIAETLRSATSQTMHWFNFRNRMGNNKNSGRWEISGEMHNEQCLLYSDL